jgi:phage RecT family recombinase
MNDMSVKQTTAVATKSPWAQFEGEIRAREAELATLLPTHISREKFVNTAIIAAKQNHGLMECDRRTLHAALSKAAEDGLQPDGREGVINIYNEKRKVNGQEVWVKVACWIPMTYGIRKRFREMCGGIVDAQVVYANDHFVWRQGDEPMIEHRPPALGKPRGAMVGAYAIIRIGDEILHREVMDAEQIGKVKGIVKAKNGLLWTTFEPEAWRKTVLRRAIKSTPAVHPKMADVERIVSRDDDQYDLPRDVTPRAPVLDPPDIPDGSEPEPTAVDADFSELEINQDAPAMPDPIANPIEFRKHVGEEMACCADRVTLDEVWSAYEAQIGRMGRPDRLLVESDYERRVQEIGGAGKLL